MNRTIVKSILTVLALTFIGCNPSPKGMEKLLEKHPEIVLNMIEKHPKKFLDTINKAVEKARSAQRADAAKQESATVDEEFKNPKKPDLSGDRVLLAGNNSSPITIVEYSDFQCPYCTRGFNVMREVKEKYGDQVRIIYKHLPLDFHPQAEPASRLYEAIAMQSKSKAVKFHDSIFENQGGLKEGKMKFLESMVKKAGANLSKAKKDMTSDKVNAIIKADMAEAKKFGFSGTPGFLVNGVSVKGAYPFSHFEGLIKRHLDGNKGDK